LDKNKTSGGQAEAKPLSDLEERLIGLIGKVVVSGIPDLPEAGVVTEIPDPESPLNWYYCQYLLRTTLNSLM
jgi:hypothetical protein